MASNKRFDEYIQNFLEKWTSATATGGQQLRADAIHEAIGSAAGLYTFGVAFVRGIRVELTGPGSMSVTVRAGLGYQRDQSPAWVATGRSQCRPLWLDTDTIVTLDPADALLDRIDRILVRAALYDADAELADMKDPATGSYLPSALVNKRKRVHLRLGTYAAFVAGTADLCVKTGTPAGVPVAPAIDAGALSLAQVTVPAAALQPSQFVDERRVARFVSSEPQIKALVVGTAVPGPAAFTEGTPYGGASVVSVTRGALVGRYTAVVKGFGALDLLFPHVHPQMPPLTARFATVGTPSVAIDPATSLPFWSISYAIVDDAGLGQDPDHALLVTSTQSVGGGTL